jgi:hypothetical protein
MHKHIHPHLHTIVHAHKQANNTNTYTSYKYIHETAQIVYQETRAALSYMVTLVALQTLARCGHLTTVWHQCAARGRAPEILRAPFSPADSPCAFVAKLFTSHAAAALPAGRQPCAPRNVNEAGGWGDCAWVCVVHQVINVSGLFQWNVSPSKRDGCSCCDRVVDPHCGGVSHPLCVCAHRHGHTLRDDT